MDTDTVADPTTPKPPDPITKVVEVVEVVDVVGLSDAELEERICVLAGRLAVAEAEFLRLLVTLDERGLWGNLGMRSAAHWLSWRLGMGLTAAREKVRVAHALRRLPGIAAAFGSASLSYCKVRALTRVATPATEAELLELALGATGAQLERIVRAWRRVLLEESSATATVTRSLRRRDLPDGSVVFTVQVPPDDAAVIDAAVAAAGVLVRDADGAPIETPEETRLAGELTEATPRDRADADAFVLLAESFCATGAVGRRGDGLEVVLYADLASLRPPATDDATGTAARTDVGAEAEVQPEQEADAEAATSAEPGSAPPPPRPPGIVGSRGQPLLRDTALRRMCESAIRLLVLDPEGRPLDVGRAMRHATRKQRAALRVRDQGACRFPGCTQTHRLIPHHVHWWSLGGGTDLDNLVLVCPSHHRALHEVGYGIRALGDGVFAFSTPAGDPVTPVGEPLPAPPQWTFGDDDTHDTDDTDDRPRRRPWVTPPLPAWGGQPMDLGHLIDGMVANTVNATGRLLPTVALTEIPAILRQATGWPLGSEAA